MDQPARPPRIYYLEMLAPEQLRPKALPPGLSVRLVAPADPHVNRWFYEHVGQPWQWIDRLQWSDRRWQQWVSRPQLQTWVAWLQREPIGYFELEEQPQGNVQIVLFGLLPQWIGRGLGGAVLSEALRQAWAIAGTRRVWLHTCSWDHPHALDNYLARGLLCYRTEG